MFGATIGGMPRTKVSLSLDPVLVRDVDAYVANHEGSDRSKVVGEALQLWSAARQRSAMELQFADEAETDASELETWRSVRRRTADRLLRPR